MKLNMGIVDRSLRTMVAILVGILFALGVIEGVVAYIALTFAGIFLLTSFVGFCPLYLPLKLNTRKDG